MSLADLVKPLGEEDIDELAEEEIEILQDAHIIPQPSKGKARQNPRHIVFVDTLEDGTSAEVCIIVCLLTLFSQRVSIPFQMALCRVQMGTSI